ncbi:thioesterase family protein [Corynebacterium ulceribovis]|uniref:thioesterase family protein n=1 Tax=Corynebacterium ulceribovis TaxID=487732 RepID=UPI000362E07B|nr:thioesterase family protein [Corynebacterium ulceribovis]
MAYYEFLGTTDDGLNRYLPTEHTHGAWGAFQHGSPPAALASRELERFSPDDGMRTARITVNLLGPVPYTELRARTRIVRPGKQIKKLETEILAESRGEWRPCVVATSWRLATFDTSEIEHTREAAVPSLAECTEDNVPLKDWEGGYIQSIVARSAHEPGLETEPQMHWVNTEHQVVAAEEPTAIEHAMSVVDTANGIGAVLNPKDWAFMNVDLTVHFHREPEFGWLGIRARGNIGPDGVGMTGTVLYDEKGAVGRAAQALLVRPQPK